MSHIKEFLSELLKDLAGLPEEKMRLRLIARRFSSLGPEEVAASIDVLYRMGLRDRLARELQSLFVNPENLKRILGSKRYRLTYLASLDMGLKKVSRLFTDLPPRKKGFYGYESEEDAPMEHVALGQRRMLAKGFVREKLDRLLSDPDPVVISNLLNNPRITERDVLRIASKRPNSPHILKLIVEHKKWSRRYAVIKAVAQNPYTPPRISVGILEMMLSQDLQKIAADKTLHMQVKAAARDILEERMERKGD